MPAEIPSYEARLDADVEFALMEGGRFFGRNGSVHDALKRITQRLDDFEIPYAVAGGMALFLHGYRRFTEDVDLLVTPEGLERIHEKLRGRGYLPIFEGSRNLRDTVTGVRIEFLVTGQFPGDGRPKEIAFPDPAEVGEDRASIQVLNLATLIELKLASGMSSPDRLKDLADVQELIKQFELDLDFADQLQPLVRETYRSLVPEAR